MNRFGPILLGAALIAFSINVGTTRIVRAINRQAVLQMCAIQIVQAGAFSPACEDLLK